MIFGYSLLTLPAAIYSKGQRCKLRSGVALSVRGWAWHRKLRGRGSPCPEWKRRGRSEQSLSLLAPLTGGGKQEQIPPAHAGRGACAVRKPSRTRGARGLSLLPGAPSSLPGRSRIPSLGALPGPSVETCMTVMYVDL
ncbi:unnamed protein product [Caretta caretta]